MMYYVPVWSLHSFQAGVVGSFRIFPPSIPTCTYSTIKVFARRHSNTTLQVLQYSIITGIAVKEEELPVYCF